MLIFLCFFFVLFYAVKKDTKINIAPDGENFNQLTYWNKI